MMNMIVKGKSVLRCAFPRNYLPENISPPAMAEQFKGKAEEDLKDKAGEFKGKAEELKNKLEDEQTKEEIKSKGKDFLDSVKSKFNK